MRVLLVGSGGREHALAWRLARSPALDELYAAPGNPGIAEHASCHRVAVDDGAGLLRLAERLRPDLVVVGPEAPLVSGLADELRAAGMAVFGPDAAAARIEGSKRFAKEVLLAAGVLTAEPLHAPLAPCVVKADGLAAGKGVFVCRSDAELAASMAAAARYGGAPIVEELLEGEEVSLFALCDGREALALPPAQDFKRLGEGDTGPNTGGMGSYSPVPALGADEAEELIETVHRPVLAELVRRGTPFVGLLYAGLMLTEDGPRVLEFNCRFGDPETQSILPRLEGDLLTALAAAAQGDLSGVGLSAGPEACVTLVLASADYPQRPAWGARIEGLDSARDAGGLVFHAGTAIEGGLLVASGGRVLNVTASGEDIADARAHAYRAAANLSFAGMRYRRDIALAAAERAHARA